MRLNEFASAEEQMGLWKLINDSVWQAIGLQVKQEREQKAKKARQAQAKRLVRTKAALPKPAPVVPAQAQPVSKPEIQVKPQQLPLNQKPNRSNDSLDGSTSNSNSAIKTIT